MVAVITGGGAGGALWLAIAGRSRLNGCVIGMAAFGIVGGGAGVGIGGAAGAGSTGAAFASGTGNAGSGPVRGWLLALISLRTVSTSVRDSKGLVRWASALTRRASA